MRAIAPELPVVELEYRVPALVLIAPLLLVRVIPGVAVMLPVVILLFAVRVIEALPCPVIAPVATIEPDPEGA